MASTDDILTALEQAKQKLLAGKRQGLQAVTIVSKARNAVSHALGRTGAGSPVLAEMAAKERALVQQVMQTDALIARVDQAIAQARAAAGGSGGGRAVNAGSASGAG